MINSKIDELEGLIGADIRPHDRQKVVGRFKGKTLQLNFYPVIQIANIFVNGYCLDSYDYELNNELGVIYFNHHIKGRVIVQYTTGLFNRDFEYAIMPLIKDMVAYTLTYSEGLKYDKGISGEGRISSLKEGDVSINFAYDSSLSLGARINNRIDDLKSKYSYSTRLRWI